MIRNNVNGNHVLFRAGDLKMTIIRSRDLIRCRFPTAADPVVKGAYWKVLIFRRKNISSIPFTVIGTILSAPFVKTMNTLPNPHQSKDLCPTTKRCNVSCRPSNSRATLSRNSGISSVMRCRFRLTIFPWKNIRS